MRAPSVTKGRVSAIRQPGQQQRDPEQRHKRQCRQAAIVIGGDHPSATDRCQAGYHGKCPGHADKHRQAAAQKRLIRSRENEGQDRQNAWAGDRQHAAEVGQDEQEHGAWRPISGSGRLERQSDAIHAIPQTCRLRTIVEHMPQMAATALTMDR